MHGQQCLIGESQGRNGILPRLIGRNVQRLQVVSCILDETLLEIRILSFDHLLILVPKT